MNFGSIVFALLVLGYGFVAYNAIVLMTPTANSTKKSTDWRTTGNSCRGRRRERRRRRGSRRGRHQKRRSSSRSTAIKTATSAVTSTNVKVKVTVKVKNAIAVRVEEEGKGEGGRRLRGRRSKRSRRTSSAADSGKTNDALGLTGTNNVTSTYDGMTATFETPETHTTSRPSVFDNTPISEPQQTTTLTNETQNGATPSGDMRT
jgi:hypothetical protein